MSDTPTRAVLWLRVSTEEQVTANQRPGLHALAAARGWQVIREVEVEESAFTGAHEPALAQQLEAARRGEFDVFAAWALDRVTRGGAEKTLRVIREFAERGVRVITLQEPWTEAPIDGMHDILASITGWAAHEESKRRGERIRAGLARRKDEGKPVGRAAGTHDKRKRRTAGYHKRWSDPAARERHSERMRAWHAARKGDPDG